MKRNKKGRFTSESEDDDNKGYKFTVLWMFHYYKLIYFWLWVKLFINKYKTYSSFVLSKHLTTEIPLLFLYPSFILIFS